MSNAPAPEVQPLRRLILGYRLSQALGVVARLGIADLLKDGPLAVEQLASRTGVQADPLARVLRLLTGEGVFREVGPNRFALTPAAQPLRSDVMPSLRARAMFNINDAHWTAWGKLFEAVQTGEPAFERAHGAEVFAYLRSHPDDGALFNAVMAEGTAYTGEAVTQAYGIDDGAVLVDVGGGAGALLLAFLASNRTAQGILFDQPHVVDAARARFVELGLESRCRFVAGDFFTGPIPEGGTHYFLKHVLHDWNDEDCIAILKRCRAAMAPTARLVIVEVLLPPPNMASYALELDVQMLVLLRGRERRVEEYARLLTAADLEPTRVVATAGDFSLVEAKPRQHTGVESSPVQGT